MHKLEGKLMARLAAAGRPKCRSSSLFYAHGDWPHLRGEKVCTVSLAAPTSGRRRRHRHHHTALDRVTVGSRVSGVWCVVVWCGATHASRGSGVVWRVSRWVGLVLRLVCEVLVSVSCPSRVCPGSSPGVFEHHCCLVCLLAFACLLAWSRSESRWGERGAGP